MAETTPSNASEEQAASVGRGTAWALTITGFLMGSVIIIVPYVIDTVLFIVVTIILSTNCRSWASPGSQPC